MYDMQGFINSITPEIGRVKDRQAPAQDLLSMQLYDPNVMAQLQQMFQPYFQSQMGNVSAMQGRDTAAMGRMAGAQAAAGGYANPGSFVRNNAAQIAEAYAPQYGALASGQLGQLLGATSGSQQFRAQNTGTYLDNEARQRQLAQQWAMFQEQMAQQPSFLENLFSGLIGGGASIVSAGMLGGWGGK